MSRAARLIVILLLPVVVFASAGCDRREAVNQYNAGIGYLRSQEYPRAILAFNRALELRPDFPEANNSLGYVYNRLQTYDKAIAQFEVAASAEKYKDRHLAYRNLGTAFSNNGEYGDAETALTKSIELEPTVEAQYALAQVYALQEKTVQCIAALRDVLAVDVERARGADADLAFARIRDAAEFKIFVREARR
ncbi:MAG: tetratricopeptide repeat protein [Candidatus Poribacteria bacterium]